MSVSATRVCNVPAALFFAALVALGAPHALTAGECEHVVRSGDSLSRIASSKLGDSARWWEIAELNGITDSGRIAVGMTLALPCDPASESSIVVTHSLNPFNLGTRLAWLEANPRYAVRACGLAGSSDSGRRDDARRRWRMGLPRCMSGTRRTLERGHGQLHGLPCRQDGRLRQCG